MSVLESILAILEKNEHKYHENRILRVLFATFGLSVLRHKEPYRTYYCRITLENNRRNNKAVETDLDGIYQARSFGEKVFKKSFLTEFFNSSGVSSFRCRDQNRKKLYL